VSIERLQGGFFNNSCRRFILNDLTLLQHVAAVFFVQFFLKSFFTIAI